MTRSYGHELGAFAENGWMQKQFARISDLPITERDRKLIQKQQILHCLLYYYGRATSLTTLSNWKVVDQGNYNRSPSGNSPANP
ncbi:DUF1348 family protein [Spirosoma aureum]|uniref:DUF1348 family protein n=1 Tax=Spirosoma aureum TaxID=2692134 RepID=UPI0037448B11